jgi:hypothetical protein
MARVSTSASARRRPRVARETDMLSRVCSPSSEARSSPSGWRGCTALGPPARVDGPVVAFGSWAGSDMDGHPEVGAETLARTLGLHRESAVRLLRDRVLSLARRYSHADHRVMVLSSFAVWPRSEASGELLALRD